MQLKHIFSSGIIGNINFRGEKNAVTIERTVI